MLGKSLKVNTTLTDLDLTCVGKKAKNDLCNNKLTDNKIGDLGAKSLGEALASNTALTKLNLNSDDGLQ